MDLDLDLDLDDDRQAALATTLEQADRAYAAVRYGTSATVGAARVVLNPDSLLPAVNTAGSFRGGPGAVEATLELLPALWAEAGLPTVHVHASPASVPELGLLCDELGYEALLETSTLLLLAPDRLVDGEPGRTVRPLPEQDEDLLAPMLGAAAGWSAATTRRQARVVGHRLDDARYIAVGAYGRDGLVGVATGFRVGAVGAVVDVAVAGGERGRGTGRALVSAVAATHLAAGASLVWTAVESGGRGERALGQLGFAPAYETVVHALRL